MHTEVNEEEEMKDSPQNDEDNHKEEQGTDLLHNNEICVSMTSILRQILTSNKCAFYTYLCRNVIEKWCFKQNVQFSVGKSSGEANKNLATLTKEDIAELADRLGADWKKLATELAFPEDDIDYFASEPDDKKQQAIKMLTVWMVSWTS